MTDQTVNNAQDGQEKNEKITITRPQNARYLAMRNIQVGVKPGYVLRKVGQAFMVMPSGPRMKDYQGIITLNETGAFLFKESQKPEADKESLMAACKSEYGASDDEALQAVDSFMMQCAECGLFEYRTVYIDTFEGKEVTEQEFRGRALELAKEEAEAKAAAGAETKDQETP